MYRRALLASLSTLAGPLLAGCGGETSEPAAGTTAPDDDDSADGKHAVANHSSDDDPADDVELLCEAPAHEISEDSRCASLDYVTWELWGAIRKDSARVARSVTGDPEPITLSDGTQIAQRDQRYEVTVDEHLVITPLQDSDESVYKVGDRVRYRWDHWTLATIDGDEATLEPLEQLTSLKITWEVGEYVNAHGTIYVVDIEPEERIVLCPLSAVDTQGRPSV